MIKKVTIFFILTAYAFGSLQAQQDSGFIYGKITTIDGNEYFGEIRWGKEEAYWNDHFNSVKSAKYMRHLTMKEQQDAKGSKSFWEISIWDNSYSNSSHQFTCQFGDIKSIKFVGRERVQLELKNGNKLDLSGGSNDLGTTVNINDPEIGEISLRWDRISKVEFSETPGKLDAKYGNPLFGIVKTVRHGNFKGFIQWDHDERIDSDKLDGSTRDGKTSIAFRNIASIERKDNARSEVVLKSGRVLIVSGSNDVNAENRGIIITIEDIGKINIPWRQFIKATFDPGHKGSGKRYGSYKPPKGLPGAVETIDGEVISGMIVYDLDEAFELEILEGMDDELEYKIPFRNIKRIAPKNYSFSSIELRNGKRLLLGESRDVSNRNDGLLVFEKGREKPKYIAWKKVEEIVFD